MAVHANGSIWFLSHHDFCNLSLIIKADLIRYSIDLKPKSLYRNLFAMRTQFQTGFIAFKFQSNYFLRSQTRT